MKLKTKLYNFITLLLIKIVIIVYVFSRKFFNCFFEKLRQVLFYLKRQWNFLHQLNNN